MPRLLLVLAALACTCVPVGGAGKAGQAQAATSAIRIPRAAATAGARRGRGGKEDRVVTLPTSDGNEGSSPDKFFDYHNDMSSWWGLIPSGQGFTKDLRTTGLCIMYTCFLLVQHPCCCCAC